MIVDLWRVRAKLGDDEIRIWVIASTPAQATKLIAGRYGADVEIVKMEGMGTGELLGGHGDES